MHDDYPSPPSSSSSRRSIQYLCPHSSPRASKASDIAHLLDPSYSPTRVYHNQIYVDQAGEAHDPDFRLFAPAPASFSPKRREFLTCESDDGNDSDADADHEHDARVSIYYKSRFSPKPKRASFDSARSTRSAASDPTSYARDVVHDAPAFTYTYTFEKSGYVSDDEPPREANKLRRRRASLEQDRPAETREPAASEKPRGEWTSAYPSNTTATTCIKRQWHALRLRTHIAAFHARKRVTRIVSPSAG